ncbi:HNH endonuclease [Aerosakkonemataceae cyanobacterium BLCC-F154]|uniref:HNH endonuclease n=1 Tax=Floridaenema fluviatile BLCC-F154 TaxID=3153640 RepID=A0ABV4YFW9_9CYAN
MSEMEVNREEWLTNACAGFVTTKPANRNYYRLILETLWPSGHDIPGPIVLLSRIRQVIDDFRATDEPYQDVPRRIRELQGEEGFLGIVRLGSGKKTRYQLVSLEIGPQREQRIKLSDTFWEKILRKYQHRCAVCGRQPPVVSLEQDHKIPRLRGGGNEEDNWQPLCRECNNFKSTACRGCDLECNQCAWAFPEKFAPIKISSLNIQRLRDLALKNGVSPDSLLNEIIERFFA